MQHLESTKPHFVRCIKPNSKQTAGVFEKGIVLEQLRCCEVLEVVRISRSGYATRMAHQEFMERFSATILMSIYFLYLLIIGLVIICWHDFQVPFLTSGKCVLSRQLKYVNRHSPAVWYHSSDVPSWLQEIILPSRTG